MKSCLIILYLQNLNLVGSLTVKDNLKIGYLSVNESLDGFELKAKEVLEKVFLGDRFEQKVKYLSGGEKQRITIARALLKDAKVILADEPCASLDVENAQLVYKTLEDLSKDHLVIVVSHDDDYIQECEKNGNITIIDMNDKDKYINNYEVCESSIDIKEKKVSHTNFLSKSFSDQIHFDFFTAKKKKKKHLDFEKCIFLTH